MKIIIVGASGKIGKEVDKALSDRHEIIRVGAHSGDIQADYTDTESVRSMFEKIGKFDSGNCELQNVSQRPLTSDKGPATRSQRQLALVHRMRLFPYLFLRYLAP